MQSNEKTKFYAMLSEVMSYYKQDTSEFMLSVFWDACKGVEFEQVAKALNNHVKDPDKGQFAPKVADVVRLLVGTKTDRSVLAWGRVYESLCAVGAYKDVCFDDPAIHAAISDCGGWMKMCRSDIDELSYLQHRFAKSYQAYAGLESFTYPKVLIGDRSPDSMYLKRGLPVPEPVFIGDKDKAMVVYQLGGPSKGRELTSIEQVMLAAK